VAIEKRAENHGMPWEKDYGYSQALKVGVTIYLAGQVGHDDKGEIVGQGNIEVQMRQAYANVKKILSRYGATMDNVVDEIPFVTDMDAFRIANQSHVAAADLDVACSRVTRPSFQGAEGGDGTRVRKQMDSSDFLAQPGSAATGRGWCTFALIAMQALRPISRAILHAVFR
jgi:enamine deaminase RidA (YjgF/YER057c/UK114 family)